MSDSRSILVAVDLPSTAADLEAVSELAAATGWPVHLLHVAAPESALVGFDKPGGPYDHSRRNHELVDEYEALAHLVDDFEAKGITAKAHIIVGSTVATILAQAKSWNVAQIAIIGHKHSVAHRIILGSVASTLLKVSPVPVLVMPTTGDVTAESSDPGFVAAVDRLIDVIDRSERSDELAGLRAAAESQLAEPNSDVEHKQLGDRLRETVQQFEIEHPSLTRAANDVSNFLSGWGI